MDAESPTFFVPFDSLAVHDLRTPRSSSMAFETEQRAAAPPVSCVSSMISSPSLMSEVHASHPLPLSWSLTGKRGRKKLHGRPEKETQEHDIARLLLMLSSPSPSPSPASRDADVPHHGAPRGRETDSWEEEGALSDDGEGERRRRLRRAATTAALHECEVCTRRFRTGRALGGHMKNHWERDLKGRVVKKKMRKISAIGLGMGLGPPLDRTPPPRTSPATSHWVVREERGKGEVADVGGESFEKRTGASSPPTPLLLSY